MRANLEQYTKQEIIDAFHAYMDHVGYEEGTTFVARYHGNRWPNEVDNEMPKTTVDIIHAIDEALGE